MGDTMKAVNYQGAFKVKVEDVPKPKLEHPDDIIVKVTTAGRCPIVEPEERLREDRLLTVIQRSVALICTWYLYPTRVWAGSNE